MQLYKYTGVGQIVYIVCPLFTINVLTCYMFINTTVTTISWWCNYSNVITDDEDGDADNVDDDIMMITMVHNHHDDRITVSVCDSYFKSNL